MFCKIVEQMFYKVAGLGHRIYLLYYFPKLFKMVKYATAADLSMRG